MDLCLVGNKIREIRKILGLSQEEIAEGICSQAQICKIEKGEVSPSAATLYLIAKRLGVDINYFFDAGTTPRLDYIQEVEHQLRLATREMRFDEVKEIVDSEMKNPIFTQNNEHFQLLLWYKGIYEYKLNKNTDTALYFLKQALSLTHSNEKVWSERELDILNSLGIIHLEENRHEEALDIFNEAFEHLKKRPIVRDESLIIRLSYNKAKVLTRLKKYQESIDTCSNAIDEAIKNHSMYLFGQLYYQIGYNYELMQLLEKAMLFYEKSISAFEIQKDFKFIDYIQKKINQIKRA